VAALVIGGWYVDQAQLTAYQCVDAGAGGAVLIPVEETRSVVTILQNDDGGFFAAVVDLAPPPAFEPGRLVQGPDSAAWQIDTKLNFNGTFGLVLRSNGDAKKRLFLGVPLFTSIG